MLIVGPAVWVCVCLCVCVPVMCFVTSDSLQAWTVTLQALLSMEILQARMVEWIGIPFSKSEYRRTMNEKAVHTCHL